MKRNIELYVFLAIVFVELVIIVALWRTLPNNTQNNQDIKYVNSNIDASFILVEQGDRFSICRETKTDVMYALYHGGGYRGGMTVMLDKYGNPLLYEAWESPYKILQ